MPFADEMFDEESLLAEGDRLVEFAISRIDKIVTVSISICVSFICVFAVAVVADSARGGPWGEMGPPREAAD